MNSVRKTVPIILGILILTGSAGFELGPTIQTVSAEPSKRVVGYFPYWESGDVDSINYSKVTDIIYFHIWPNPDGTLDTSAVNVNDLNTINNNAHSAGVNVLISIGGWGVSDGFPAMVADNAARENFVSNIVQYVSDNNLDGVDIDWETQITQEKIENQDLLLADLSNALRPLGKLVTVAANGEIAELQSSASGSVDWVNVMAYDMNWGSAEHSTFDDSVSSLQRYETEGIPKDKLVLGIPFYGRDDNTNAIKYEEIVSDCNPLPAENNCNGYFFNGMDMVQQKTQYVLDNGYEGVMVWNLGQDTYDQTSLLTAINLVLGGQPSPITPVHLENLEITKSGNKRWSATVTATISEENSKPVSGATVQGTWSGGSTGMGNCTTDSEGICSVSKSTKGDSLTFTIDNVSGASISYNSSANIPNSSITINREGIIPGNDLSPTADAGGPYSSVINTEIGFDGSGSTDPEGLPLTYLWNFGDGNTSTESNPSYAYASDGTYDITLTVTDSGGNSNTDASIAVISPSEASNLSIFEIFPNSMIKGQVSTIKISGSGFEPSTTIQFSGAKWSPSVKSSMIIDS
ncbi:MAG: glycosyl hydrolase family 18 protein, partial [Nitrosopumilaceae archaeon]